MRRPHRLVDDLGTDLHILKGDVPEVLPGTILATPSCTRRVAPR